MTKIIQITGEFEIEDDEYDPGDDGPLTEAAFAKYNRKFKGFNRRFYTFIDEGGAESGPTASKAKSKPKAAKPKAADPEQELLDAANEHDASTQQAVPLEMDLEAATAAAEEAARAAYEADIASLGEPFTADETGPLDPALMEEPVETVVPTPEPVAVPENPVPAAIPPPAPVAAPVTDVVPPPMPMPTEVAFEGPAPAAPPVPMAPPMDFGPAATVADEPHPDDEEIPF